MQVASLAVSLVIGVLFRVTMSDLVAWAVAVAFVAIAIGSGNFVVFGKQAVVVAGHLNEASGIISVHFVDLIWVVPKVALLLKKKFIFSAKCCCSWSNGIYHCSWCFN